MSGAALRIVERPAPFPDRLPLATLIACYRDRVEARRDGALRLGDLDALRRQFELYRRDYLELSALVNELDRLEAGGHV